MTALTLLLLSLDVLQEDARGLDQLDVDQPVVEVQNALKRLEHVLLDQVVQKVLVELLRVDGVLRDVPNDLHHHLLVALRDQVRRRSGFWRCISC